MLKKWTITFNVDEEELKRMYGNKDIETLIREELHYGDICHMYVDKIEKTEDKTNDKNSK